MAEIKKIVVLFSGTGTNLARIIKSLHKKQMRNDETCAGIEVVAAITNKADAKGIEIASSHYISTVVIDHKLFDTREAFDAKLVKVIQSYEPDLVVLAGFMRILTDVFTSQIQSINLHPSLLPKFKGAQAIERSFDSVEKEGGVSVHYVTKELDAGSLIIQKSFVKEENESLESFTQKIKALEYELLPVAIKKVLCG